MFVFVGHCQERQTSLRADRPIAIASVILMKRAWYAAGRPTMRARKIAERFGR